MFDWLTGEIVGWIGDIISELTTNIDGLVALATKSPSEFNESLWGIVTAFNKTAVLPVAYTLLGCFLLIDLVAIMKRTDAKGLEAIHLVVVVFFKIAIGQTVLSNVPYIIDSIFGISAEIITNGKLTIETLKIDKGTITDALENEGALTLLGLWFQCLMIQMVNNICTVIAEVIVNLRYIEIYAFTALAAIPMAVITSSNREVSSIGYGFIKRMCGLSLQVVFIMVVFLFYTKMMQTETFTITGTNITASLWTHIGYSILLVIALFQTGSWSKALFGAH